MTSKKNELRFNTNQVVLRGDEKPLHDGYLIDVVLGIHPERLVRKASEDVAREDGLAFDRLHLWPNGMQTGHADAGIELVSVVFDVVEVVLEPGLIQELINRAHSGSRIAYK